MFNSDEIFKLIIERVQESLFMLNEKADVLYLNKNALKIFGYLRNDYDKTNFFKVISKKSDFDFIMQMYQNIIHSDDGEC